MKKHLLTILITFLTTINYSQITFEKGYYINNSNKKVDCLIKNIDWRDNPTKFEYQLSVNDEIKIQTIDSVKEFGINNFLKYIRYTVNIDKSTDKTIQLSNTRKPLFREETVFLKTLIEGKAKLFEYKDEGLIRFFFKSDNFDLEQLIYKRYKLSEYVIHKNNFFKNQLWGKLKCNNIARNTIEELTYEKKPLVNFFKKYNSCNGETLVNYNKRVKRDLFNLNIRPGINNAIINLRRNNSDIKNTLSIRFGIEGEFILSFNKNKWSAIVEPIYQYFDSNDNRLNISYHSFQLSTGVRHYLFLNDRSKFFVNGLFIFRSPYSSYNGSFNLWEDNVKSVIGNFGLGAGYKYNEKYSVEFRYHFSREILEEYGNILSSNAQTISLIIGYSFF